METIQQIIRGEIKIIRGPKNKWQASCLLSGGKPSGLTGFGASYEHPYKVEQWPSYDTSREAINALCKWLKEDAMCAFRGVVE